MSLLEMVGTILTELEKVQEKLDRLLSSREFVFKNKTIDQKEREAKKEPTIRRASPGFPFAEQKPETTNDYSLPKTGKYQWYRLKNDKEVKLRKCSNGSCPMFLKWNDNKKKYEHWKYDTNTGVGGYVQDNCDHYLPEGL